MPYGMHGDGGGRVGKEAVAAGPRGVRCHSGELGGLLACVLV